MVIHLVFYLLQILNSLTMHHEKTRNARSRKEDKELVRAIFFFTIVAIFIGILLVKGGL